MTVYLLKAAKSNGEWEWGLLWGKDTDVQAALGPVSEGNHFDEGCYEPCLVLSSTLYYLVQ